MHEMSPPIITDILDSKIDRSVSPPIILPAHVPVKGNGIATKVDNKKHFFNLDEFLFSEDNLDENLFSK